jgi:hypothetical protein
MFCESTYHIREVQIRNLSRIIFPDCLEAEMRITLAISTGRSVDPALPSCRPAVLLSAKAAKLKREPQFAII